MAAEKVIGLSPAAYLKLNAARAELDAAKAAEPADEAKVSALQERVSALEGVIEGKRVLIRELTVFESMTADAFAGRFSPSGEITAAALGKSYAICAIRKIDDQDMTPLKGDAFFQRVASSLTLPEFGPLLEGYYSLSAPTEGDGLKNGSEATPSA